MGHDPGCAGLRRDRGGARPGADRSRGRPDGHSHPPQRSRVQAPPGEALGGLAAHGATLVIHLGTQAIEQITETLAPHYGWDCPAALVAYASRPEEQIIRGTLATIGPDTVAAGIRRSATIVVGPVLAATGFRDSHLYDVARTRQDQA